MQNLFIGKFTKKDQYEGNFYQVENEREVTWFNGLSEGDYVLPSHGGYFGKLLKCRAFVTRDGAMRAIFDVVKTFLPELTLAGNIVCCKYFSPEINLLNKVVKSTKGYGFHKIELENSCPSIDVIDFYRSQRRFLIILKEMLSNTNFFKPSDICIVINNLNESNIEDILEYNGQNFKRYNILWGLYQEKIDGGSKKYSLRQLLDFADAKKDAAPKKEKYLNAVLAALEADGYFMADNAVSLYDNVLVGRKQYISKGVNNAEDEKGEDDEEDIFEENHSVYSQYARLLKFNPNIILYGPPGTGKTYGAMRIIEAFESQNGNPVSYKTVQDENRVRFITFHQAFSYEEFVEGLRPETDEKGNIRYEIKPGILKRLAEECKIQERKKSIENDILADTTGESKVWKVSLGRRYTDEHIYKALKAREEIAIGYGVEESVADWTDEQIDAVDRTGILKTFRSKVQIGDIVFIFNSIRTIRLIGIVVSDYYYTNDDGLGYGHRRKVKWIKDCESEPIDIFKLNQEKQLSLASLYELKINSADALKLVDDKEDKQVQSKPYYLVIDEINRGNIAKIFGELITLIEKDKREKLSCLLPYSGHEFSLPKNLYIIGTMNTSDRSIALLDTALRRRFAFIEISPDPALVESRTPTIGGNVSPAKLMKAINQIITEKIDRDHRIGHSYFLSDDLISKMDLYHAWYYKILPLLMEYFYNDISQVADIVGDRFFDKQTGEIVMLGLKANESGVSDFESALMSIYERGS
ncbi:MAG: AAA family ATPase [Acetivibrionales bacterium]|jgi:5-methylcytosine-specific restriction protein B